ncbi:Sec-independent protein translocase protein TatA [Methylocaldum marinum]|uniref:Sec-independent protein translocase protein TatA n=1 Tax=Methylocaldum marinum TaxID=1432792 RepID=A0A250KLC0_9GAMM|nr:twin-arginine translocase TatA/TatE family subunit [Methylocaldum marinum]BBA32463.1 Sec-independent protein translocase protein TatA [Methylocaldum marinum]
MGIGVWQVLLVFMIVLLVFGTKKLRTIGGDLGGAIRSFRKSMNETEDEKSPVGGRDGEFEQTPQSDIASPKV